MVFTAYIRFVYGCDGLYVVYTVRGIEWDDSLIVI